ncbi:MAG: hypothetical protein Q7I99_02600 [Acholeplasmataceae bacterium]|nr:hypothetical protein [Acholeplasmataceae bacterium]
MKNWLRDLENALSKKFYKDEVSDIVSYYQEMIEERLSGGEKLEVILEEYDIKDIVKTMTPDVLVKRKNDTYPRLAKSVKQLLVTLLSTPLLIPIAVIYASLLIFAFSMIVVSGILVISTFVGFVGFSLDFFTTSLSIPNLMVLGGFSLMMVSMLLLASIWIYQMTIWTSKQMLILFSKIAKKAGETQ